MDPLTPSATQIRAGRTRRRLPHRFWQWVFAAFAVGVIALMASRIGDLDWSAVRQALRGYRASTLSMALLWALCGYVVASSYDLIGRRHLRHRLAPTKVCAVNAITYAFSLNLGALLGGWAFRVRLYTRYGLSVPVIAQVIVLAMITNWSGFILLAGLVLLIWPPVLPLVNEWRVDPGVLRAVGAVLLGVVLAYVGACALGRRRQWSLRLRGVVLRLPSVQLALLQLLLSSVSWLLMGAALWQLLPAEVPFTRVLVALFFSSVAGAALHVPGGIGVLEFGIARLLSDQVASSTALAAVLAFRAVYYLLPLVIALLAYIGLELAARRRRHR